MIIFNKHLSNRGHPGPFELLDRINIYELASMSRGQAEGPGAGKSPETVVVGKRFKILVRGDGTTGKCYSLRILPNIVSDLEAGFLSRENELAKQLKKDWRTAYLSNEDKALCSWVEKLTLTPGNMNKKDVEKLENVGFSQSAISDAAEVVGYFNYINRIADGLGVDLEDEIK